MCLGMMGRCDVRRKGFCCCDNNKSDFRVNCVIAALINVWSTNRIDVAKSKSTCFAHYMIAAPIGYDGIKKHLADCMI